jgi:hypothetical protein
MCGEGVRGKEEGGREVFRGGRSDIPKNMGVMLEGLDWIRRGDANRGW